MILKLQCYSTGAQELVFDVATNHKTDVSLIWTLTSVAQEFQLIFGKSRICFELGGYNLQGSPTVVWNTTKPISSVFVWSRTGINYPRISSAIRLHEPIRRKIAIAVFGDAHLTSSNSSNLTQPAPISPEPVSTCSGTRFLMRVMPFTPITLVVVFTVP